MSAKSCVSLSIAHCRSVQKVRKWADISVFSSVAASPLCAKRDSIYKTTQSQTHKKSKQKNKTHIRHLKDKRTCTAPGRTKSERCWFKISSLLFPVRKHKSTCLCILSKGFEKMIQMACSTFPNSFMIAAVPLSFIPPATHAERKHINRIIQKTTEDSKTEIDWNVHDSNGMVKYHHREELKSPHKTFRLK